MHEHASYYLNFKLNRCQHDFSKSNSTNNNLTNYLDLITLFVGYQCQVAISLSLSHTQIQIYIYIYTVYIYILTDLSSALDLRKLAYFDFLMAMFHSHVPQG